ncbi:MAG: type IV secretory system conjugative DNA transfer family protein [Desulfovibrio sp.]|jgi:hypothetical protein|nr:type IV secretory system conjugative DNA transfer family protein [Desulfovibrio sp.]
MSSKINVAELPVIPISVPQKPETFTMQPQQIDKYIHSLSYQKGFQDGIQTKQAVDSNLALCIGGVLLFALIVGYLLYYISRLLEIVQEKSGKVEIVAASKKTLSSLLPLALCVVLAGCAEKVNSDPVPPVPLPPQIAEKSKSASQKAEVLTPKDADGQYLTVTVPADSGERPRRGEPGELAKLLEMKGPGSEKNTAVTLMRPMAIREAAQLVTIQTAIAYRYKQLLAATEGYSAIMDAAFDFSPLVMTHGEALIMPPLLTRAGASMRIEEPDTATASETSYELLAPAAYISTVPNWREFLMADAFPAPEKPNPAVMPKDDKERAIWRAAVREAWAQGLAEADQLYADNVARMTRQYRGVMLYHLLTAQHLLNRVNTASADLGLKISGNKLNIGQKVYRITAPSSFTVPPTSVAPAKPVSTPTSKQKPIWNRG